VELDAAYTPESVGEPERASGGCGERFYFVPLLPASLRAQAGILIYFTTSLALTYNVQTAHNH
jgi:hypothetical protein